MKQQYIMKKPLAIFGLICSLGIPFPPISLDAQTSNGFKSGGGIGGPLT